MLILDMSMPHNCSKCPFNNWSHCNITDQVCAAHGRPSWCPIKYEIPEEAEYILVSRNATNKDVIKDLFPEHYKSIEFYVQNSKWWNEPYKGEGKEE